MTEPFVRDLVRAKQLGRAGMLLVCELGKMQKPVERLPVTGGDRGHENLRIIELVIEEVFVKPQRVDHVCSGVADARAGIEAGHRHERDDLRNAWEFKRNFRETLVSPEGYHLRRPLVEQVG